MKSQMSIIKHRQERTGNIDSLDSWGVEGVQTNNFLLGVKCLQHFQSAGFSTSLNDCCPNENYPSNCYDAIK